MASGPAAGGQRKSAMRSPLTWVVVLGIALAGGAYLLYRRSKSAASPPAAATTGTTASDTTDYSGQIATLQTEIEDLQSSESNEGKITTTPITRTPGPPTTPKPGAPENLRVTGNNGTSVQVSWDLPGGVKGTTWSVTNHEGTAAGKIVDQFTTNNTVANLGGADASPRGLKPGTRYVVIIQGKTAGGTGPSGSLGYTTKAAPKPKPKPKPAPRPKPKTAAHSVKKAA